MTVAVRSLYNDRWLPQRAHQVFMVLNNLWVTGTMLLPVAVRKTHCASRVVLNLELTAQAETPALAISPTPFSRF